MAGVDSTEAGEKSPTSKSTVVVDKAFARRVLTACEGNPNVPMIGRGKQKWVRDNLLEQFGISVSPEAVRKWFAGESRPRRKAMTAFARLLEVDEAWLALGITPDMTLPEKQARNAAVDGAVNLVAGLLQMAGAQIAYPESGREHEADLFAIVAHRQHKIRVSLALAKSQTQLRFNITADIDDKTLLGVVQVVDESEVPFGFRILRLTTEVVKTHGHLRGDFWELDVEHRGLHYRAGDMVIPEIVDLQDLEGSVARVKKKRAS